jgi:hypothetical protein
MKRITNFNIETNGSFPFKILLVLLPTAVVLLSAAMMTTDPNAYSQSSTSNTTTPATLEELDTEEFSQIVISSSQINELNSTINNAIKATEEGNTTQVLLELKILQNQLALMKNP